jgi:peptidoglycan/xylan/chitin deacetylase (PgdA/CDA1 family)
VRELHLPDIIVPTRKSIIRNAARSARNSLRKKRNRIYNLVDPPVVVLTYHRVTALSEDPQSLAVSPENFRDQIFFLKEHFPVARFDDDWSRLKKPAVVITFDDGYADNALEALPILEKAGVPATFFISTGTLNTSREFWWDELERIMLRSRNLPGICEQSVKGIDHRWSLTTENEKWLFYLDLHRQMKLCDAPQREAWLSQLRDWARLKEEGRVTHWAMNDAELCRLAESPLITVGAHTVTHTRLSILPVAKQEEEIVGSKRELERKLGKAIRVFSYPFGSRQDYTLASRDICREAGFVRTAANFPGQVHRWTDPHQIPRHLVRNWTVDTFAQEMAQFLVG